MAMECANNDLEHGDAVRLRPSLGFTGIDRSRELRHCAMEDGFLKKLPPKKPRTGCQSEGAFSKQARV